MTKHFELTANARVKWGRTLYQIRATIAFGDVKKGQLGGWVESEDVIAKDGVWLYPDVEADCDARFYRGEFRGGEFWGGVFRGGEFWGGVFRGGVFWGGEFRGGEFWGGVFRGGVFRGGEFWGGVFRGGVFWGGVFRGGEFWGGVFRGGVFRGGVFRGGVFWGGEFKKTSDYIAICSIGSDSGVLTAYMEGKKLMLNRGCFNGTIAEFKAKLTTTHGNNEFAKEYGFALAMIEARFTIKAKKS